MLREKGREGKGKRKKKELQKVCEMRSQGAAAVFPCFPAFFRSVENARTQHRALQRSPSDAAGGGDSEHPLYLTLHLKYLKLRRRLREALSRYGKHQLFCFLFFFLKHTLLVYY